MAGINLMLRLPIFVAMMLAVASGTTVMAAANKNPVEHTVEIKNFAFHPAELDVRAGDTVTWINRDFVPHNVSPGDAGWRSTNMVKGEMFSLVVDAGFSYVCTLHKAAMTGAVNVVNGD